MKTTTFFLFSLVKVCFVSTAWAQSPLPLDIPIPEPPIESKSDREKKAAKLAAEKKKAEEKAAAAAALAKLLNAPKPDKKGEISSSHVIKAGGSLSLISAKVYARPGYWRVLKLHNGVSPEKLQAGQVIKAPNLDWLLTDSNFAWKYPIVYKDFMTARRMFMEVEDKLEDSIKNDTIKPAAEDRKKIRAAIALLDKCRATLGGKRKGVKKAPSAAILQIRTASRKMERIARGTSKAASDQNLVHEHLSNSIVYAVLWARADFK